LTFLSEPLLSLRVIVLYLFQILLDINVYIRTLDDRLWTQDPRLAQVYLTVLRIRNKSCGSGSGLKLVSDPDPIILILVSDLGSQNVYFFSGWIQMMTCSPSAIHLVSPSPCHLHLHTSFTFQVPFSGTRPPKCRPALR